MGNQKVIWDADDYNKSNGGQRRDAKETIAQIFKDGALSDDMVIVDIGCGSGNVTEMLSSSFTPKKIFASDIDAQMVDYCNQRNEDKRIEYFVQDISVPWEKIDERLRNLEGKIDLVWSNRVLHWVSDKHTAAKNIARLMKPGGRCYINITLFRDTLEFDSAAEQKEVRKYFPTFTTNEAQSEMWASVFENCGLSQVSIELLEKSWTFDSEELQSKMFTSMDAFFHIWGTESFKNLPSEEKGALLRKLKEKSLNFWRTKYGLNPDTHAEEDKLTMYYEQFRVIGSK